MKKMILLLLMMTLVGCSKQLDIQLAPEVQMVLSSNPKQKIHLTAEDKGYVILNDWLRVNNSGWFSTSGKYQGGVYVKSGEHGIQITKTKVIIYSTQESEPKALYAQEIKAGELNFLVNYGN